MTDVLGKAEVTTPPKKPWSNTTKTALVAGVSIIAAVVLYKIVSGTKTFPVNTAPYVHNMEESTSSVYSGGFIVRQHQWGVLVVDTTNAAQRMLTTVVKQNTGFQPGRFWLKCDCWSSVFAIAATPTAPKWVVTLGRRFSESCPRPWDVHPNGAVTCGVPTVPAEGTQVYRLDGGLRYAGAVTVPKSAQAGNSGGSDLRLEGDFAYVPQRPVGIPVIPKWSKVDLNTLSVVAEDVTDPPPFVPQPNIDGYTYTLAPVQPIPPTGAQKFLLTGTSGAPAPTPTPVASDPFAAWDEELAREGITAGCGAGKFCPDQPLTREQAAVWLLKTKHGSDYVPPPCQGTFVDVPCAPAGGTQ